MKSLSKASDRARIFARLAQNWLPQKDGLYCLYQRCGVCDRDRMCRLIWVSYVCKDCDTWE